MYRLSRAGLRPGNARLKNRIPEWLGLTAEGKFLEAAELSRSTSNMPEICSRVCPQERLCEGACILNARSDPVAIGAVEKFINGYAFAHGAVESSSAAPNGSKVAVVGSGPGGMACADELAKLGYAVTVFEAQSCPAAFWSMESLRSNWKSQLWNAGSISCAEAGVTFRCGIKVGRDISLSTLRNNSTQFIWPSAHKNRSHLIFPALIRDGVFHALPFLIQENLKQKPAGSRIDVRRKTCGGVRWRRHRHGLPADCSPFRRARGDLHLPPRSR